MLYIAFNLSNPFKKTDKFGGFSNRILHCFEWKVPGTKFQNFSLQIDGYNPASICSFGFDITTRPSDHTGWSFDLTILGCGIILTWYDSRHEEDYETDRKRT